MTLEVTSLENGILKATLIGRLDLKGSQEIDMPMTARLATSRVFAAIDMSQVEFVASIGIRTLISAARAAQNRGGKVVIVAPTPDIARVLALAGLHAIIPIHDTLAQATADLEAAQKAATT